MKFNVEAKLASRTWDAIDHGRNAIMRFGKFDCSSAKAPVAGQILNDRAAETSTDKVHATGQVYIALGVSLFRSLRIGRENLFTRGHGKPNGLTLNHRNVFR